MKRILLLGVNGFIGHHLSKRVLAATDWEIYGMDMQSDRVEELLGERRFHFFEGDITINKEWIEYHIRKCDTVVPLVAIATPATYVKEPLRVRSEEHTSELQSRLHLVCRLLLEKKKQSISRALFPKSPSASRPPIWRSHPAGSIRTVSRLVRLHSFSRIRLLPPPPIGPPHLARD